MQDLKFGIEIEGAVKELDYNFQDYLLNFKSNNDITREINLKKTYDDGDVTRKPVSHEDRVEFKSSKPIPQADIKNHIKDFKAVLNDLDYMYNPETCGFHVHISPLDGDWKDNFPRFVYNVFFTLAPFVKFFKNRRNQRYCLTEGRWGKLIRFFAEDIDLDMSKKEFLDKWNSSKGNLDFSKRNMLRLNGRGYDTVEVRLFPPNLEFMEVLIKIIENIWQKENKVNASECIEKSIYEVLKENDLGDSLKEFKKYYERWIK